MSLARMAEQELAHPVHYTIELESKDAYLVAASNLTGWYGWVYDVNVFNGRIPNHFKRNCVKAQGLEVNVYYDERKNDVTGERERSAHIVVSKKAPIIIGN